VFGLQNNLDSGLSQQFELGHYVGLEVGLGARILSYERLVLEVHNEAFAFTHQVAHAALQFEVLLQVLQIQVQRLDQRPFMLPPLIILHEGQQVLLLS